MTAAGSAAAARYRRFCGGSPAPHPVPRPLYHVASRGNGGQSIFLDDLDREAFLGRLGNVLARCGWLCHAYCPMTNHYHLVMETPRPNLAPGMRQLNGTYAGRL